MSGGSGRDFFFFTIVTSGTGDSWAGTEKLRLLKRPYCLDSNVLFTEIKLTTVINPLTHFEAVNRKDKF